MRNEKTGKKVASDSGILMAELKAAKFGLVPFYIPMPNGDLKKSELNLDRLQGIAASALTQAPDKKPQLSEYVKLTNGKLAAESRLQQIAAIIEGVGNRCMAADGPVTHELKEMRPAELRKIYRLAKGRK